MNSTINFWYLLELNNTSRNKKNYYHLEAPGESSLKISLTEKGLKINQVSCPLWSGSRSPSLEKAKKVRKPYVEICDGTLLLRNKIEGYTTTKEWVVEFLRSKVWGGETITSLVKNTVYKDKYLQVGNQSVTDSSTKYSPPPNSPSAAHISPTQVETKIAPDHLGLTVTNPQDDKLLLGKWYAIENQDHMFVSLIYPRAISEDIMNTHKGTTRAFDAIEKEALVYLVAFDLTKFDLHFALGTDHPRLGWSDRVTSKVKINDIPGPDGIGNGSPLVRTGIVAPKLVEKLVATFTGGFKRSHGAFKYGNLALINRGSHYGFMESGVIFSKLQPNLATAIIHNDGKVTFKSWTEKDNLDIKDIRHARQNGAPLLENGVPGALVRHWGKGNWSGNELSQQRTLRAGMCLREEGGGKFLIYGYFSSVTSNAMARVFQAYGCSYGMHLDMNALEHTYMARYISKPGKEGKFPQHLIKGMSVLDQKYKRGGVVPRFVGYPDNRDFFYLLRK